MDDGGTGMIVDVLHLEYPCQKCITMIVSLELCVWLCLVLCYGGIEKFVIVRWVLLLSFNRQC